VGPSMAQKPLIKVAVLVAAVGFFFPGAAGYAWALGWLPVYAAVCHFDKIFGPAIDPDGYRIYLIGRGCDVNAAIRNILAASQFAAGQDEVDAGKITDVYHAKRLAVPGNEFLAVDLVRQKLREFAASTADSNTCPPANRYCTISETSDQGFPSTWVHAYLSYVQSQFRYTVTDGADYITSVLRMGLVAQVITTFCYLTATLFAVACMVRTLIRRFAVSWRIAKDEREQPPTVS